MRRCAGATERRRIASRCIKRGRRGIASRCIKRRWRRIVVCRGAKWRWIAGATEGRRIAVGAGGGAKRWWCTRATKRRRVASGRIKRGRRRVIACGSTKRRWIAGAAEGRGVAVGAGGGAKRWRRIVVCRGAKWWRVAVVVVVLCTVDDVLTGYLSATVVVCGGTKWRRCAGAAKWRRIASWCIKRGRRIVVSGGTKWRWIAKRRRIASRSVKRWRCAGTTEGRGVAVGAGGGAKRWRIIICRSTKWRRVAVVVLCAVDDVLTGYLNATVVVCGGTKRWRVAERRGISSRCIKRGRRRIIACGATEGRRIAVGAGGGAKRRRIVVCGGTKRRWIAEWWRISSGRIKRGRWRIVVCGSTKWRWVAEWWRGASSSSVRTTERRSIERGRRHVVIIIIVVVLCTVDNVLTGYLNATVVVCRSTKWRRCAEWWRIASRCIKRRRRRIIVCGGTKRRCAEGWRVASRSVKRRRWSSTK